MTAPTPRRPAATARAATRKMRREQCIPDHSQPPKPCRDCATTGIRGGRRCTTCWGNGEVPHRFNPAAACPHGTEGGYTNWGCECAVVPGTDRPGCGPVALQAAARRSASRRELRRNGLRLARDYIEQRTPELVTTPAGGTPTPPMGNPALTGNSALAYLDNLTGRGFI